MSSESVSEAFAAIFMRWCMPAHIAAVTARITVFCMNGGSDELSRGKSQSRVRVGGRTLHKQAFKHRDHLTVVTCVKCCTLIKLTFDYTH